MKHALIAVSTILVVSFAFAGETTMQPTTTSGDSPLVKAAKSTNRSKKSIVITNESLKTSAGHITTTKSQPPVYVPPSAKSEQAYQELHPLKVAPRQEKPDDAKKAAAQRQQRIERMASEAEDEGPFSETDPAMLEHQLEKNAQQAPKQDPKKP